MPVETSARLLQACSIGAAALVLAMLLVFLTTGIGQDPLQYVHPAADYAALLLRRPPVLRAAIGLDNAFIVLYGTVFVLLVLRQWPRAALRPLLAVALPLLMAVALLDIGENMHFLAMLSAAEQGLPPGDAQIQAQAVESLVKFHGSYLGLFLLGCALPADTAAWRALKTLLLGVQWPVGIAIYVAPAGWALPLVLGRFAFFLASFVLLAWIHRPRHMAAIPRSDAAGSGAPA